MRESDELILFGPVGQFAMDELAAMGLVNEDVGSAECFFERTGLG